MIFYIKFLFLYGSFSTFYPSLRNKETKMLCPAHFFRLAVGLSPVFNKYRSLKDTLKKKLFSYAKGQKCGCYKDIICKLPFILLFCRCHLQICHEIKYFERKKQKLLKIWGDVSSNADIKYSTQRQIITCKELWWEKCRGRITNSRIVAFLEWQVLKGIFSAFWKLNIKNDNTL